MKLRLLFETRTTASELFREISRKVELISNEFQEVEEAVFAWEGVPYNQNFPIYSAYLKRDPRTGKHSLKSEWPVSQKHKFGGIRIRYVDEIEPENKISPGNPLVDKWLRYYDELSYWTDKQNELAKITDYFDRDVDVDVDEHGNIFHDEVALALQKLG